MSEEIDDGPEPARVTRRNDMALLSRAAESVYWTGRYLERVETTARLLQVHTAQYLDTPRSAGLTWAPLLAVTGTAEVFDEMYPACSEEHVVEFLTTDTLNPGSVIASLAQARENVRTTRAVFPREVWEGVNDLYFDAVDLADEAVPRWSRHGWLGRVIDRCHALVGIMASTMTRDEAYEFLRIGRYLERADMTSRVLDVRAGSIAESRAEADGVHELRPYEDLQWMGVLRSLAADQAYRRKVQTRIQGSAVLQFLLQDVGFPRSVAHSLVTVSSCLDGLNRHGEVRAVCERTQAAIEEARVRSLAWEGLSEWVDELQVNLGELHVALSDTYFALDHTRPSLLRASA